MLGPAVIGAGARIGSRAVVAHATIGPDCVVPGGRIVRDRAWFESEDGRRHPSGRSPGAVVRRTARAAFRRAA